MYLNEICHLLRQYLKMVLLCRLQKKYLGTQDEDK